MVLAMNRTAHSAAPVADEHEDVADISALIARLTGEVNEIACEKTKAIQHITNQMKMLALNALIESSRAGAQGAGFAVVAQEVRNVGQQVEAIARDLESQLTARTGNLITSIDKMTERARGERMVDLALNAIELIDRNLYERTCDVRWWATDSAVVDAAGRPNDETIAHVSERLSVIIGAYTVYLDLWLCDMQGNVIATGVATVTPHVARISPAPPGFAMPASCAPETTMSPAMSSGSHCSAMRKSRPTALAFVKAVRPMAAPSACSPFISTGKRKPAPSSRACVSTTTRPASCWWTRIFA